MSHRNSDVPRNRSNLFGIAVVTASVYLGQGVVAPVLPQIAADLQIRSSFAIGLILSIFALARLLFNVPLGVVSDRYGRRTFIVAGPLIAGAGLIGSGLSDSVGEMLLWRGLGGVGSAMYMTAATAYLADVSSYSNRARVMAINRGALLAGVSISPAAGGLIAQWASWRWSLVVIGSISAVVALFAAMRIEESGSATRDMTPRLSKRVQWRDMNAYSGRFVAVSLVTAAIFLTRSGSVQTLIPLVSAERLGMSPGLLGIVLSIMVVVQGALIVPSSRFADSKGYRLVVTPGFLGLGLGLALFAVTQSVQAFLFAAVILAFASGLADAAPAAYAANISPPGSYGFAMGINRTFGDIGYLIGPLALGAIADGVGFSWALLINAAVVVVVGLVFWILGREPGPSGR